MNKNVPILFKRKALCCGCTACYSICPVEAIMMVEDEDGFDYPLINPDTCIRCLMCIDVCPMKSEL